MASSTDPDQAQEAIRQKAIAESKFKSSDLKAALKHARKAHRLSPNTDDVSSMVTAFEILHAASVAAVGDAPDWYQILQVEPFAHINTIKKQYRKLALILHPDKNAYLGCEEAFKLVNEGFRVFSDRIRRKDYDMKLRIKIQEERVSGFGAEVGNDDDESTFWTACSRCRLLHKFKRAYLGHNLMCPNCKKSFKAKEVGNENIDGDKNREGVPLRNGNSSGMNSVIKTYSRRKTGRGGAGCGSGIGQWNGTRSRSEGLRRNMTNFEENESEDRDEMMTLARMQLEIKKKGNKEKAESKMSEKRNSEEENQEKDKVRSLCNGLENEKEKILKESGKTEKKNEQEEALKKKTKDLTEVVDLEKDSRGSKKRNRSSEIREEDMETMAVDDSDFYDFDKDRTERAFKKGKIWAIYDDTDGIPRHYGLVDEVVSLYPFEVTVRWLDFQDDWNEKLISWGKMGSHATCGKFKVSKKTLINQLNIFSHVVDCERAAREIYRIYPKKGSVWAVYTEAKPGFEGRKILGRDKIQNQNRYFNIVICLTSYNDIHGLSVAYLERVDGFKTLFKRREIGFEAVRWLNKNNVVWALSHQIPARKLPEDHRLFEVWRECWELDPASLPTDDV